jgi:hypothetical protein
MPQDELVDHGVELGGPLDRGALGSHRVAGVTHQFIGKMSTPVLRVLEYDAPHFAEHAMAEHERPPVRQLLFPQGHIGRQSKTAWRVGE